MASQRLILCFTPTHKHVHTHPEPHYSSRAARQACPTCSLRRRTKRHVKEKRVVNHLWTSCLSVWFTRSHTPPKRRGQGLMPELFHNALLLSTSRRKWFHRISLMSLCLFMWPLKSHSRINSELTGLISVITMSQYTWKTYKQLKLHPCTVRGPWTLTWRLTPTHLTACQSRSHLSRAPSLPDVLNKSSRI